MLRFGHIYILLMADPLAPHAAVHHFRDKQLFDTFIEKIPRSQLLDLLRKSDSLRTCNFPGFRITTKFPSDRQLRNAFRKKISRASQRESRNYSALSMDRSAPRIDSRSTEELGIVSTTPTDAHSWISEASEKLSSQTDNEAFRGLVRALSSKFSPDEIHIFTSPISEGHDQGAVRALVDNEISRAEEDLPIQKAHLEASLAISNASIKGICARHSAQLEELQNNLAEAQNAFAALLEGGAGKYNSSFGRGHLHRSLE